MDSDKRGGLNKFHLLKTNLFVSQDDNNPASISDDNSTSVVSDTGIGMNQRQIDEILSSTSVISSQGTENEKGAGLGLFLIKEFIETINSQLKIENTIN